MPTAIRKATNQTRYLLDSNVWRYVVDANKEKILTEYATSKKVLVQIAPATVNETLRLSQLSLMEKIVRLQTKPCFDRLWAEALLNSIELYGEIRRTHPEWLRSDPDIKTFKKWLQFWDKKWWMRVRKSPAKEAQLLRYWEDNLVEKVRDQSRSLRAHMRKNGPSHNNLPLNKWKATVPKPLPGWDKSISVDAWRIKSLLSITNTMLASQNGMYPILETVIDFSKGLLSSNEWAFFWLYEADEKRLSRLWLEWAHEFSASFRKTTPGTPGDTQLFNYLPDTDILVTADKGLLALLEEIRPYSPISLPAGFLLKGGEEGTENLFRKFETNIDR